MSEKVIHQVTITETDDGFRIEIKGDKERLREMVGRGGFPFGMGHMAHGPWGHRGGRGFGGGFPFGRHGFGPWGWQQYEEEESKRKEPPAAQA